MDKIQQKFKKNDKVRYIGNEVPMLRNREGVVIRAGRNGWIECEFGGVPGKFSPLFLELLP